MQDSRNPKPGEAEQSVEAPSPTARRRQWQDVLNEQLRALYDTYRADDVPPELLDLASRIEEAQRQSRGATAGGEGAAPSRNGHETDGQEGETKS